MDNFNPEDEMIRIARDTQEKYLMKRQTAYKLAIEALEEKQRRQYAFDHNLNERWAAAGISNETTQNAHKNYVRIEQAIDILEAERDIE